MSLNPYLLFNGNCKEAFQFYEKIFGAKNLHMMTFGDSPEKDKTPTGFQDKILHAMLDLGDRMLMASDCPPEHFVPLQGFSLSLNVKTPADADRVFNALAENGTIKMPIQKTFWSPRFGMLVDRFGVPWMVNCDQQPQ